MGLNCRAATFSIPFNPGIGYTPHMATLLQSPPRSLSMADVAGISQTLAEDLGRIVLKTEGFSVEDYLSLDGPYLLEYVDGSLQVLPTPDALHQAIAFVLAPTCWLHTREQTQTPA
jgi:hypothetical protein